VGDYNSANSSNNCGFRNNKQVQQQQQQLLLQSITITTTLLTQVSMALTATKG
jgi:hypothetical protein